MTYGFHTTAQDRSGINVRQPVTPNSVGHSRLAGAVITLEQDQTGSRIIWLAKLGVTSVQTHPRSKTALVGGNRNSTLQARPTVVMRFVNQGFIFLSA
ncbi:MAG: hypothetical protein J07HR59_00775 [Halorubrum sp. J07HR59]|nr:MAG: hypothetical protein J07HR59_00775 [Halorubrum sp. J07HR59]